MAANPNKPDWFDRAPPEFHVDVPAEFFGIPISWRKDYAPIPVFLAQFQWQSCHVYLLLLDFQLSNAVESPIGDDGSIFQFLCLSRTPMCDQCDQLGKYQATVYSAPGVPVETHPCQRRGSVAQPEWNWSEAVWPEVDGKKMEFIGSISTTHIPNTYNLNAFLFGFDNRYAVISQEIDAQSAEEHYEHEASRLSRWRGGPTEL